MKIKLIEEKSPILHQKLEPVKEITPEIKELISDMKRSMIENEGVGLSANQVGKNLQLFVIAEDLATEHEVPSVYINPEIKDESKEKIYLKEGCLSIPEFFKEVPRSKKIRIKAMDENGKKHKFKATGFLARVLQHEYDHLNGILIRER
jgi:peptide deformylase